MGGPQKLLLWKSKAVSRKRSEVHFDSGGVCVWAEELRTVPQACTYGLCCSSDEKWRGFWLRSVGMTIV